MSEESRQRAIGMGIAGGSIAAALLDLLVAKGIISRDEKRGVLEDAMYRAGQYTGTYDGHEATKVIGVMLEAAEGLGERR
jgi:polyhydroxyalkanoate synthesis regulator phasin